MAQSVLKERPFAQWKEIHCFRFSNISLQWVEFEGHLKSFCGLCLPWLLVYTFLLVGKGVGCWYWSVYYEVILSSQTLSMAQNWDGSIVATVLNCWLCWFYDSSSPTYCFWGQGVVWLHFIWTVARSTTLFLLRQTFCGSWVGNCHSTCHSKSQTTWV